MLKYQIDKDELKKAKEFWPDDNNKVMAIKHVRTHTGMGLKEAKTWVETDYKEGDTGCGFFVQVLGRDKVGDLMGRLFELTAEISEIHRQLNGE